MPLQIIRNDITRMHTDAIVNAANRSLMGGGGVDGAIHQAAGPALDEACRALGGCHPGEAKATPGFDLPCRYIIHTVGPVWQGGGQGEAAVLESCYRKSLEEAERLGCESVAFPLISAGVYSFPREQALRIATDTIRAFLDSREEDLLVYLVVYDRASFDIGRQRYGEIREWIDDTEVRPLYEEERRRRLYSEAAAQAAPQPAPDLEAPQRRRPGIFGGGRIGHREDAARDEKQAAPAPEDAAKRIRRKEQAARFEDQAAGFAPRWNEAPPRPSAAPAGAWREETEEAAFEAHGERDGDLDALLIDYLKRQDEGFRDMLLRKIDERGMTDAECYKRANVDRKLFNKIKNQPEYRPGKTTVLAFALALELPMREIGEMLTKAGYSLSRSSKSDLIVEFFIRSGVYDVFEINEALFAFDQKLLGSAL